MILQILNNDNDNKDMDIGDFANIEQNDNDNMEGGLFAGQGSVNSVCGFCHFCAIGDFANS